MSNPLLDSRTFVPDVEAHVWQDGRIYLYGSFDFQGRMDYCSDRYHVYSSDNLTDWVDHGVAFSLDQATWAKGNNALYAPDCAYRNGKYYLYYCVPDGRCGVAVSDSPAGPFEDVGYIAHTDGIDPAVLVDDDGQAYLYWGQCDHVSVAKLKENMVEIEPESITHPLTVAEHEFHEGSSVKKINGKYYFLFADTHRHGRKPTCLGYAVSDHPMKGFRYAGVIIDNFGCDPSSWNNHGSMVCFKGQWYIFYHRSTHNSVYSRHVCAEPIEIGPDGVIREVKMTTSGVGNAIPAGSVIPANLACTMQGNVRIAGQNPVLSDIRPGDTATYRYLRFSGENTFKAVVKSRGKSRIEVYIDGWYKLSVSADDCEEFTAVTGRVDFPMGVHEVQLQFYGDFSEASLLEFQFQ